MAILEITNGLSTKEFELSIAEDRKEYYLTVCAYGEFYDETFDDENAVREYLKNKWNFTDEQIIRYLVYRSRIASKLLQITKLM